MASKELTGMSGNSVSQNYRARTVEAENELLADIRCWIEDAVYFTDGDENATLPDAPTPYIKRHVGQFMSFCQAVLRHLDDQPTSESGDDIDLRFQVIGALTSQWDPLKQNAIQRLSTSPYSADIMRLDRESARYYQIVRDSLPEPARQDLAESTPLVSLGRAPELMFFNNQNQQAPALISIPFGTRSNSESSQGHMSLAHEIGHAVFNRIPGFFAELSTAVEEALAKESLTERQKLIHQTILNWLGEIVPDLVGASLAGADFAVSSLRANSVSNEALDISNPNKPQPLIRPYISQHLLDNYLRVEEFVLESGETVKDLRPTLDKNLEVENYQLELGQTVGKLKPMIDEFGADLKDISLRSIPAVTKITLEKVRDELIKIVDLVLKSELDVLRDKPDKEGEEGKAVTLAEILSNCYAESRSRSIDEVQVETSNWSEGLVNTKEPFFLDLSNFAAPDFAVPVTFPGWYCDRWPNSPLCRKS